MLEIEGIQLMCAGESSGCRSPPPMELQRRRLNLHELVALLVRCPALRILQLNDVNGLTQRCMDLIAMCKLESQELLFEVGEVRADVQCQKNTYLF